MTSPSIRATPAESSRAAFPENPVLVRIYRGDAVESQHRGAWVLADSSGRVIDGDGAWDAPMFARSSVKSLQALPLLESGAAERFDFSDAEIALAVSSHNAEAAHTLGVEAVLARLGLSAADLQCGPQSPADPEASARLRAEKRAPSALHNNCSGKHAGFLALTLHLGAPTASYLDPESPAQRLVRDAVVEMTGVEPRDLSVAIDGCSAPTFRLPLRNLATAFARVATPDGLPQARRAACERMLAAVARHPEMIAGRHQRICTDLARIGGGKLFPKIGGEAVFGLGVRGKDRALAIKIDDGGKRGLHAVLVGLLRRFQFATTAELDGLARWEERRLCNWAGREVGRTEVLV